MKSLSQAVDDYVALRRNFGFKLREDEACLHKFVVFLKKNGSSHITHKLALEFATQRQDQEPRSWSRQLQMIRGFARYRAGVDPKTEIPPGRLLPSRSQRARPYLYTQSEIRQLLAAARKWKSPHPLQPRTYYCVFGLLAVSGMRVGEAINLKPEDVDWSAGVLTIRGAKFGKSRHIPLHPSTQAVLRKYAEKRDSLYSRHPGTYFFVTSRGTKLDNVNLWGVFRALTRQIGICPPGVQHGPRLHDLRHRFAVETLLRWYRQEEDVTLRLPVLATYLGHANVTATYWYLSQTPQLMAAAKKRLETRWKGVVR
jgi:integrase/recombinase XerD